MPDSSAAAHPSPTKARIRAVDRSLARVYGDKVWPGPSDPVAGIVRTILSQNTTDINSAGAYRQLRDRFPDWEAVAAADLDEIAAAIESGGLSQIKARYIRDMLNEVLKRREEFNIEALAALPVGDALAQLTAFRGVGAKTAACVLLFQCGVPICPVDTHVNRLCQRLGWASQGSVAERTQELMQPLIPPELCYRLHINLVHHGRVACRPRNPRCGECVVRRFCAYRAEQGETKA